MKRFIYCKHCKKQIESISRIAKIERTNKGQFYYGTCCVPKEA